MPLHFLFVLIENRAYNPEHQSREKYRGKNRKEKELHRCVADKIRAQDSAKHGSDNTDNYIHEKNSAAAKHTRGQKPFKKPYKSPYKPD